MLSKLKSFFFSSVPDSSPKGVINVTDWKKVVIHLVFVAIAAVATAVTQLIAHVDFGQYSVFIVPFISSVLVVVQKWIKDNQVELNEEKKE